MVLQKHRDLIFDVGLHRGEDTEFFLKKGFRVVAFEADPEHVSFCYHRFKKFIDDGRLTIIEGAVVDMTSLKPGEKTISFYKNDAVSVWGTVCSDWAHRNLELGASSRLITVNAINFVQSIREHGIPHYLKVDIEGCDMLCVEALKAFDQKPEYISIESNKTSFLKIKKEIEVLDSLGYKHFQAVEQSSVSLTSPAFPAGEGKYADHRFEEGSSGLFGAELLGAWKSKQSVLRRYRFIRIGYWLLGEDGILTRMKFRGAGRLRGCIASVLGSLTGAAVPGWYDTHAKLSDDV